MTYPHVRWRVMRQLSRVVDLGQWLQNPARTLGEGELLQSVADVEFLLIDLDTDLDWPDRAVGFVLFEDEADLSDEFRRNWHALPSSPITLMNDASPLSPQGLRAVGAADRLLARMAYNGLPSRGEQPESAFL